MSIAAAASAAVAREPGHLVMFLDDQRIAHHSGLRRVVKQPAKDPSPVIVAEHPWEHNVSLYGTVLYDPDLQRYRAWYQATVAG